MRCGTTAEVSYCTNMMECSLCEDECENVSHVLWECSAYISTRANYIKKLNELLKDDYDDIKSQDDVVKSSYVRN